MKDEGRKPRRMEHTFSGSGRVDTRSLDGDDDVSTVLKEVMGVERDNSGLIRLGNIGD